MSTSIVNIWEGVDIVASFNFHPTWSSAIVYIINSCNGLLACKLIFDYTSNASFQVICILNPMTNEYIKLPFLPKTNKAYSYAFGFVPQTKQYKILRCLQHKHTTLVEIFAFGTSNPQWTHVGAMPFHLRSSHSTYFNGALYWVGVHLQQPYTNVVYRFDVKDEVFKQISFPLLGGGLLETPTFYYFFFFGVLNDALYLTFSQFKLKEYDVWKMEQDSYSWIKMYVVPTPQDLVCLQGYDFTTLLYRSHHLQLIKTYEDGNILCLQAGLDLFLYHPETGRTQTLTPQDDQNKRHFLVYQIDSFHFDSLYNILMGDVES